MQKPKYSIPINELAQLQNKILRELRRILGSEKIPQSEYRL